MAINFPGSPALNDIYTVDNTSWQWDGSVWNLVGSGITIAGRQDLFATVAGDTGQTTANQNADTLTIAGGDNVSTTVSGDILTINSIGGGAADAVKTVVTDDGTYVASGEDTLNILGRTNIATELTTDTKNLQIDLVPFEIGFLSNVSNAAPSSGQVLKWDGSQWAPGTDIAEGGVGLDADTLDGFEGSYYLDYNNFTNTPDVVTLTDLSIGNELTASGDGAISYDNTTGVFRYTPPDLSSYLTDYTVTEADVTQHEAALSITESQITDLQSYLTDINSLSIDELNDVDTTTSAPTNGQVLAWDSGNGVWAPSAAGAGDANQNAFSNVAVTGQSTIEADSVTDTLTIAAGTGISLSTDAGTDTLTITSTVSAGASDFDELGDVSTASLTVDKIYLQAMTRLVVDNNGTSAYTFDQYLGDNPTIFAINGTTIAFDLDAILGHPFLIQTAAGANYNTGLVHVSPTGTVSTGSSAQGKTSGTLYWKIPGSISGNYRYQCSIHGSMVGIITIKNFTAI
jgi:plastocyanin